ncbi:helix-turn-helix domain-containing protein [Streptomyces xiamenensis]|uniref:helix-turn-helix domain-containing protein n=1 Tax=Streptomyces xiamenensis TaxID=408015 RepID=UPI003D75F4D7
MTYRERSVSYAPLTVTQVSGLLGISRRTVLREIQRGNLAAVKPGGMYRIDPGEYAAYRNRSRVTPG